MDHEPHPNRRIPMTSRQALAASGLELGLPQTLQLIGPTHAAFALLDAIKAAKLPVADLRYLSRELDRHADKIEREARDAV
jgi:hypothetical protein